MSKQKCKPTFPVQYRVATYTLNDGDNGSEIQFDSSSAVTANLPPVTEAQNGYSVFLRNIGTGTLTIDPNGSELIDGGGTSALATDQWRWIRSDGTGWKTISRYVPSSSGNGGMDLLNSQSISSPVAEVLWEDLLTDTTYSQFDLYFHSLGQVDNAKQMEMLFGTGVGPTYATGASDYAWAYGRGDTHTTATMYDNTGDHEDDSFILTHSGVNTANTSMAGHIRIFNPAGTAYFCLCQWSINGIQNGSPDRPVHHVGGGEFDKGGTQTPVTAFKLRNVGGGNFDTGEFALYGLKY